MDEIFIRGQDLVHLARVSLTGSADDAYMLLRRMAHRYRHQEPDLSDRLVELLRAAPSQVSAQRGGVAPTPVDLDSRLELLRVSACPVTPHQPVLSPVVNAAVEQLIGERLHTERLWDDGIEPSSSALLVGPPGVGKTLSATWIAERLELPLLILDLSAVMNSLLGKTGTNLRHVLDHARERDCVMLLDEIDAVAKRRDDIAEIGELKRLVTILLQEIDRWPSNTLLLGATNHPDLLDPAIWRRFDIEIHFELPDLTARRTFLRQIIDGRAHHGIVEALAITTDGWSLADIERTWSRVRRRVALNNGDLSNELLEELRSLCSSMSLPKRRTVSTNLLTMGLSQRRVSQLTGMSRDTLRKLIPARTT